MENNLNIIYDTEIVKMVLYPNASDCLFPMIFVVGQATWLWFNRNKQCSYHSNYLKASESFTLVTFKCSVKTKLCYAQEKRYAYAST